MTPGRYLLKRDARPAVMIDLISAIPAAEHPDTVAPKGGFGDWLFVTYTVSDFTSVRCWLAQPRHLVPA